MAYVPSFAYPFPEFQPAMRIIASITNSNPAVITTTFNHQYITGTLVRFNIPQTTAQNRPGFGMTQLNQQTAYITVTGLTTFTVPIDTTNYDVFVIPNPANPPGYSSPQVVPVGELNGQLTAAVQNVLPYP